MIVYTLQPKEVYETLLKDGVFHCSPALADWYKHCKKGYDWLVTQMEEMIGPRPCGVTLPIWAWYKTYGENKKPDLRRMDFHSHTKEPYVCLTLDIPDEDVVLSDEPAWTCYVLNDSYFDNSQNEEEFDFLNAQFDALPNEEKDAVRLESWKHVFDVEPFRNEWTTKGEFVQATFWELKLEYVKHVQPFID